MHATDVVFHAPLFLFPNFTATTFTIVNEGTGTELLGGWGLGVVRVGRGLRSSQS